MGNVCVGNSQVRYEYEQERLICSHCQFDNRNKNYTSLKDGGTVMCVNCRNLFHPASFDDYSGTLYPAHKYNGSGPLCCHKCYWP